MIVLILPSMTYLFTLITGDRSIYIVHKLYKIDSLSASGTIVAVKNPVNGEDGRRRCRSVGKDPRKTEAGGDADPRTPHSGAFAGGPSVVSTRRHCSIGIAGGEGGGREGISKQ